MRSYRMPLSKGLAAFFLVGIMVTSVGADEPNKPTPPASEKNPAIPAAGHSVHGEAFDEGPRRAATLMKGMGKIQFPVTTSNPEAQAFISQGVAQLHSFFYLESERSFRQAAKLDPKCAMAYWGMAMANVNNAKRARGFLKEANLRKAGLSRREVLYIEALEALHKESGDDESRKKAHLRGLEVVNQEFPDDLDARAWLAMVIWQNGKINSRQAVDIVLDTVLAREPVHPGAHHYRIHLWDGDKPERGTEDSKPEHRDEDDGDHCLNWSGPLLAMPMEQHSPKMRISTTLLTRTGQGERRDNWSWRAGRKPALGASWQVVIIVQSWTADNPDSNAGY